jgi:hypothetical protein
MTRAPYMTNNTLRRSLYLLRTNRHALTKRSTWQNMMTPTKCHAYLLTTGKVGAVLKLMRPAQPVCQLRTKAPTLRKSP